MKAPEIGAFYFVGLDNVQVVIASVNDNTRIVVKVSAYTTN
jgi:hypothetical protein